MYTKIDEQTCPTNAWWAIFLESFQLACNVIGSIGSVLFLLTVLAHHELRHNLSILLATNLSFGGLVYSISMIAQNIYMLVGCASDRLCPIRTYTILTGIVYAFQSAFLQTLQRLFLIVFVHHHRLQNKWLFFGLGLAQFSGCLLFLLPLLLNNNFVYHPASKICFMDFRDIFAVIYAGGIFYFMPLAAQSMISYWILRHVSRESQATQNSINAIRRIRKERRVLARLALPVILLLSSGLIYFYYFFVSIAADPAWQVPPYAFHLCFLGSTLAISITMVANIFMQKQVKEKIIGIFPQQVSVSRDHTVHPTTAQQ